MSWEALTWALEDAPGVPTHLVAVLMGLANHAGKTGRGAFASQATLAGYARKSDRAVRNDIKELVSLGLIVVSDDQSPAARVPGDARPVVYDLQLHLMKDVSVGTSLPPGSGVPGGSEVPTENQDNDGQATAGNGSEVPGGSPLPGGSTAPRGRKPTSDKPSTNQNLKKKTSSSSSTRGSRIPEDFHLTPDMIAWGEKNYPRLDGDFQTMKFINHFRSAAGAKGVKVDWRRTWENWMHTAAEQAGMVRSSPPPQSRNGHRPFQNQTDPNAFSGGIQ